MIAPLPIVSVIIPTLHRPNLILRALTSVLNQTYTRIEVLVVVDGPDTDTLNALAQVRDDRLRLIINQKTAGSADARNRGAAHAKGEWLAFLDDDDEWLPMKIEHQMREASGQKYILVSCQCLIVKRGSQIVRPGVIYDGRIPLDEYLFDRRSPFASIGFIQTSSYLVDAALFDKTRFKNDNPHDDWDFLLRLSKLSGARILVVPEVLTVVHVDEERPSLSSRGTWIESFRWVERVRPMLTRRGYSGFCLSVVGSRAAHEGAYVAGLTILFSSLRYGSPRLWQICAYLGYWILPARLISKFRKRWTDGPA